jgi:predicted nucleic acid-binding protein
MSDERYTFTREQLVKRLTQTVEVMKEYRDVHGHDEAAAILLAVSETVDGLDADQESGQLDGKSASLQVIDPGDDDRGDTVPIFQQ